MSTVVELLKSFGLSRLAAIIGVTAGVGIALIVIMVRIGEPQYSVLYADLDYGSAQDVISRLEQDGVRFQMREAGTRVAILVARDDVSALRVSYAGNGFAGNDTIGYEIFDGQQALGTTSFQQNINRLRALEGELGRTVSAIAGVRAARVHLVMPERTLFSRDQRSASASIMIEATSRLDPGTVRAIINLTASAVPELTPEQITVLDANGNLLASARGADQDGMAEDAMSDRMAAAEARLQQMVSDLVGSIVGPDNVRTQLTADFDFSRFTETSEIVDPDSQVVLSSTLIEESSDDQNPARSQGVSIANSLPGSPDSTSAGTPATSSNRRTEEITNYEITKTVRNTVRDEGLIVNRLSVAVAINAGNVGEDSISRSPEELQHIEALVKSAIGFDQARGDQVEIVNIAFTPATIAPPLPAITAPGRSPLSEGNLLRFAEIGSLFLIAAALVIFVLRPMFGNKSLPQQGNQPVLAKYAGPVSEGHLRPHDGAQSDAALSPVGATNMIEQRINIAQIDGQVKASSVHQIQEIVKGHTDESALIIKRWIREAI